MRTYLVQIGSREIPVAVSNGKVVAIDGVPADDLVIQQVDRNRFTVLRGRGITPVAAVREADGYDAVARGVRLHAAVKDEREQLRRSLPRTHEEHERREVRAPMPALVVRVEVRAGESVKPGQTLVVLEAMKMENDVRSGAAGTVETVKVEAGAAVEKDQSLITMMSD